MTNNTKPLDKFLDGVDEAPTQADLEALLPAEPVQYVLTSDQWSALKTANEMIATDQVKGLDFEAAFERMNAINDLVTAFLETSEPRFTDVPETDPAPDQDVTVTLPVFLFVGLFSALHAAWHIAHRGSLEVTSVDESTSATPERQAEVLALIDATHTRALAYVQPYTNHFNHTVDGVDL